MTDHRKLPRRRHSAQLKAQVLAECARPDASVAAVAMAHGLNANVVHKWPVRLELGLGIPDCRAHLCVTPHDPFFRHQSFYVVLVKASDDLWLRAFKGRPKGVSFVEDPCAMTGRPESHR